MPEIAPTANSTPGHEVQQQAAGMLTGVLISGRAPAAALRSAAVALSGWRVHAPVLWQLLQWRPEPAGPSAQSQPAQ